MLAEPTDLAILSEVQPGGAAASRSGPAGAAGLPPNALDPRCPCCVASQHHTGALPFLQVCPLTRSAFVSQCRKHFRQCLEERKCCVFERKCCI